MDINALTTDTIEQYASLIHREMGFENKTQIDLVSIAHELGFRVYSSDFTSDDVSGMVINTPNEKIIYINKSDSIQRKRFTVAHEIGHIVLHHKTTGEEYKEIDFRSSNKQFSVKEAQANSFAAALLMPREKAIKIWNSLYDVDDFADAFRVSKQAAAIRLSSLGLI